MPKYGLVITSGGQRLALVFDNIADMRRAAVKAVQAASYPHDIGGSNARISAMGQARDLLDSGGSGIRLPNGRIEAKRLSAGELP